MRSCTCGLSILSGTAINLRFKVLELHNIYIKAEFTELGNILMLR